MLLDEDKYKLNDKINEKKYNFSLEKSMAKAQNSKTREFLKGIEVYATSNVTPRIADLEEMVKASGGRVCLPIIFLTTHHKFSISVSYAIQFQLDLPKKPIVLL